VIRSINQALQSIQNILLLFIGILLSILIVISTLSFIKLNESSKLAQSNSASVIGTKTPSPTPIPTPTIRIVTPDLTRASRILNLTNWKLTLPTGSSEKPTEIKQPELNTFEADAWFISVSSPSGVRFRAPVNGVTTGGSNYPRSELREMTDSGSANASWSSTSGTHTMTIDQAIAAVPSKKKHIVAGQIHDKNNDVIVIRLEDNNLYVNVDGDNKHTLDSSYTLGKRFSIRFVVKDGETEVYYNGGTTAFTLNKDYSGAYFKAGAYTQSNCSREESANCNDGNFGEVIIYNLSVTHQ